MTEEHQVGEKTTEAYLIYFFLDKTEKKKFKRWTYFSKRTERLLRIRKQYSSNLFFSLNSLHPSVCKVSSFGFLCKMFCNLTNEKGYTRDSELNCSNIPRIEINIVVVAANVHVAL